MTKAMVYSSLYIMGMGHSWNIENAMVVAMMWRPMSHEYRKNATMNVRRKNMFPTSPNFKGSNVDKHMLQSSK